MEERTDERLLGVLNGLEDLSEKIAKVAAVEESFEKRLDALNASIEAGFKKQREIEENVDHLTRLLERVEGSLKALEALDKQADKLAKKIDSLDLASIGEKAEEASEKMEKAAKELSEKSKDTNPAFPVEQKPKKTRK